MQNNSAVKEADKEAIAYLNSSIGQNYTADPNVSEDIYNLFVNKYFVDDVGADYVVVRTVPMTPMSDPDSFYFNNQDRTPKVDYMSDYGYKLLKEYDNGEKDRLTGASIVVQVYGK
jgi:hypothetical protein